MAKVAMGDTNAFHSLYKVTSKKLFGFALRILHKKELAEDVLQESFIAAWNNARDYRSSLSAPMTWMTTIVRNKAFDALRTMGDLVEIDGADFSVVVMSVLEDPGATPMESLQMSRDACALAFCMAQLDSKHRQVVSMAFFHDLSHTEISQQLALPLGTIKTWIRRSLECLRISLRSLEHM